MKRLLLIAKIFPPEPLPGALRPGYLARYLPQFGWDVTVLTQSSGTPPFPARVIHAGAIGDTLQARVRTSLDEAGHDSRTLLRAVIRSIKDALLFPDQVATWIPPAVKTGSRILREERFDAILGTALPATVHVVGSILARRSGLPWIADYRDPWAGNVYDHANHGRLRRGLEAVVERRLLGRAAAVTTISAPIAAQIGGFLCRNDVHVIPNAYDPAEWNDIPDVRPAQFDLCFTGQMYNGKRTPAPLFAALDELRKAGDPAGTEARVRFYGQPSTFVSATAQTHGVGEIVTQYGRVPRAQAMQAQRSAAALLIFLNMDPGTAHEMGSKFLEYVGARRPIIAIGPPNSVMREFLQTHRLGWFASNAEEAKAALRAAHERFASGLYETAVDSRSLPTAIDLARRFADVLDSLTAGTRAAA